MWKVGRHGSLVSLSNKLAIVDGSLARMPIGRRMSIVTMESGELAVINAMAVDENTLTQIRERGTPRYLLVPNAMHTIDAPAWAERFPDIRVLVPRPLRKAIERKVRVDGTLDELPANSVLSTETAEGTRGEALFRVVDGGETSLIVSDLVFNLGNMPGLQGLVLRILGSTGGPKVTRLGRLLTVKDREAARQYLHRLADTPGLRRIIVSHGDIIDRDPAATLHHVADGL